MDLETSKIMQKIPSGVRQTAFNAALKDRDGAEGNPVLGLEREYLELVIAAEAQANIVSALKTQLTRLVDNEDITADDRASLRTSLSGALVNEATLNARLEAAGKLLASIQSRLAALETAGT